MTINISELEALRAKMTPGPYSFDGDGGMLGDQANADGPLVMACFNDECMSGDGPGLAAEHNAIPALLAAIKAALAYRDAVQSRPGRRYRNSVEDAERDLYVALEAVTP